MKEASYQSNMIPLNEVQEKAKLIYADRDENSNPLSSGEYWSVAPENFGVIWKCSRSDSE